MIKAEQNFCLTHAVKLKSQKYFSLKCTTDEDKGIFFGFKNGKLGKRKLYNIVALTINIYIFS